MKTFPALLFLCLTPPVFGATFTLVQSVRNNTNCNNVASCSITVTSTGTGNLLVVMVRELDNGGSVPTFTVSGGGTWVTPAGCQTAAANGTYLDQAYVLSSSSGTTTVTATIVNTGGPATANDIWFYEVSFDTAITFGACGVTANAASNYVGVAFSLMGTNSAIFQGSNNTGGALSAIDSGYTYVAGANGARAGAYKLNTNSGTAPTWTESGSNSLKNTGIYFYQSSGVSIFPPLTASNRPPNLNDMLAGLLHLHR